MARWNTLRWPLSALALAALVVAAFGMAGSSPGRRLHSAAEKRLLALVANTRTDVAQRRGTAAHTALARFVSDVSALQASGQMTAATADSLDRQARAAAAHINKRLAASAGTPSRSADTPDAAAARIPSTTTTPSSASRSASMQPIAIPVKHDPGARLRVPALPGQSGHPFGDRNHRFPHGDAHRKDWHGGEGD